MEKLMTGLGNLYVAAAPSGTGKTTLVKVLVESLPNIAVSISYTTRPRRPNEQQGLNYHFVDKGIFEDMIARGDFLEYAVVFDHLYGTSKVWVEETLARGIDVILEIDWQGQQQIKRLFPDMISIFILPPSLAALKERLTKRGQDQSDVIEKRLADVSEAVLHVDEFQYMVVNDELAHAMYDLQAIIKAGGLLARRQKVKYTGLINELVGMS
jgi:guanylate kinase